MSQLKNIIFDLGGVILDLSVPSTLMAFSQKSGLPPETVTALFRSSKEFEQYERGELDDAQFREFVRNVYNIPIPDEEIDACWNAMLLGLPLQKLALLDSLKARYRTFLLSNTNGIHLSFINDVMVPRLDGVRALDEYFHRAYYSHLMGTRKPEIEIYRRVLDENGLRAEETIFFDDNPDNVKGAQAAGIRAEFVNTETFILDYFND